MIQLTALSRKMTASYLHNVKGMKYKDVGEFLGVTASNAAALGKGAESHVDWLERVYDWERYARELDAGDDGDRPLRRDRWSDTESA